MVLALGTSQIISLDDWLNTKNNTRKVAAVYILVFWPREAVRGGEKRSEKWGGNECNADNHINGFAVKLHNPFEC